MLICDTSPLWPPLLLGFYKGASAQLWRDVFPGAELHAVESFHGPGAQRTRADGVVSALEQRIGVQVSSVGVAFAQGWL